MPRVPLDSTKIPPRTTPLAPWRLRAEPQILRALAPTQTARAPSRTAQCDRRRRFGLASTQRSLKCATPTPCRPTPEAPTTAIPRECECRPTTAGGTQGLSIAERCLVSPRQACRLRRTPPLGAHVAPTPSRLQPSSHPSTGGECAAQTPCPPWAPTWLTRLPLPRPGVPSPASPLAHGHGRRRPTPKATPDLGPGQLPSCTSPSAQATTPRR